MKKVFVVLLVIIGISIVGGLCYYFRDYLFQQGLDTNEVPYNEITKIDETKKDENKFNVYLFYSDGDLPSENLKSYLYTLSPDLLGKFTLYTFEVSTSEENKNLLASIKYLLNVESDTVPVFIVGNQVLTGFTENDYNTINTLIESESSNETHYDVLTYINDSEQES